MILQQLHYWLINPKAGKEIDGQKWIFNTYAEWQENFPFWSERTIQRAFLNLEEKGLVITKQHSKTSYDRTKYYTIDYAKLATLEHAETGVIDSAKMARSLNDSENTAKTTTGYIEPIAAKISELKFPFNPNSGTIISIWKEDFTDDVIIRALEMSRGKGISYADKILIGWKANGVPPTREQQVAQARTMGNKRQSADELHAALTEWARSE